MRDDSLLPVTRWLGVCILPVLVAAFVIMFLFPTRTTALWAWTVNPPVTATTMGGSYLAGAYFFLRVSRARRWHTIGWGFPAITAFTTLLLVATLIHWDLFNHDHASFWAWLLLYSVTPPLLPWVWWRNRLRDPGEPDGPQDLLGQRLRAVVASAGGLLCLFVVVTFLAPSVAVDVWPWPLTELTARTTAAFAAFPAITLLTFAWEPRWSALARPVEATTLGLALTMAGVLIHFGDLTAGAAGKVAYVAVLGTSVAMLSLLLWSRYRLVGAVPS